MQHTLVMTGASRGIGRVAAEHILRRSPDTHLLLVARGSSGARLAAELSGHTVSHVPADLGSLESVHSAATGIRDRLDRGELPPLRGFVGNAGTQYTDALTESPDGFEATFAVNVLANHLFVRLLQDRFAVPARIVITASDTHFGDLRHNLGMVPGPAWKSPNLLARTGAFPRPHTAAAGRTAYSTSKLAAIHLVHEYARRLPAGIDAVAYNPGFVPGTGLARNAGPVTRFAMRRILPVMTLTPFAIGRRAAGRYLADIVLGTTPAPTGSYVDRSRVARSSEESYDPRREHELWEAAERFTAAYAAGADALSDDVLSGSPRWDRTAPADSGEHDS
ncbi:SDR family NAD(P)-dependent oxidoreductase [Streptomyces fulvoviolaceus]|uniref:SDR family NAD(P)-dependent oxidoreductase n=1 Tax=Streptomyces fulvoviolaceus TaxID=285535 RepID=UPI0021BECA28|nr:SDR family NAD(P)-dependent oxidoreductase [Streptomyces fulvoviolaceus]MCT9079851.1 SDR family NAD(P)-dependent oxidoreductase [Streptomyces fulvoviolaceus]